MGTVCTVRVLPAGTQTLHQAITHLLNLPLTTMSAIKQNFHLETEAWINKQINMELYASYVYLSMSAYFARTDIALHGFAKRFRLASAEETWKANMKTMEPHMEEYSKYLAIYMHCMLH